MVALLSKYFLWTKQAVYGRMHTESLGVTCLAIHVVPCYQLQMGFTYTVVVVHFRARGLVLLTLIVVGNLADY